VRVTGKHGSLHIHGAELARLGEYKFDRERKASAVVVSAKVERLDRFLAGQIGQSPIVAKLDFRSREHRATNVRFEDGTVSFVIEWASSMPKEGTGTDG